MKTILLSIGIIATLLGLLWIGQGTGLILWPASSFMLDQRPWAVRGIALAIVGVGLIFLVAPTHAIEIRIWSLRGAQRHGNPAAPCWIASLRSP